MGYRAPGQLCRAMKRGLCKPWHFCPSTAPATTYCQRAEQKRWAPVSMGNPIQCKVNYFKKSDSLSSLTTETYFSAAELLPQPVFYRSVKMHVTRLPWAHSTPALQAACLSCRELLSGVTGCQYLGLLRSRTARAMLRGTATGDFAHTKQGKRYEHRPRKHNLSLNPKESSL